MNDCRLWECPRCRSQYLTTQDTYHAVCGCLRMRDLSALLLDSSRPSSLPPLDVVFMREIPPGTPPLTPEHPYRLIAVPWTAAS